MKQLLPSQRAKMNALIAEKGLDIKDFIFAIPKNEVDIRFYEMQFYQIEISMNIDFRNVFLIKDSIQGAVLCDIFYSPSDNDGKTLYLGCNTFEDVLNNFNQWLIVLRKEKEILIKN